MINEIKNAQTVEELREAYLAHLKAFTWDDPSPSAYVREAQDAVAVRLKFLSK